MREKVVTFRGRLEIGNLSNIVRCKQNYNYCFSIPLGILGLGRCFRRIDDNGDKSLSLDEFTKGLADSGLDVGDDEAEEIFNKFDADGSGTINMTEFLIGIRVCVGLTFLSLKLEFKLSNYNVYDYCSLTCPSHEKG